MNEPNWLPIELVIKINQEVVNQTGERHILRDAGLLDNSLNKPLNYFLYKQEEDIVTLAVVLLFGIARAHPFEQGNKRTAFVSAIRFLEINGYTLDCPNTEHLGEMIVKIINGNLEEADLIDIIRSDIVYFDE